MRQSVRTARESDRDALAATMEAAIAAVTGPYDDSQRRAWRDAVDPTLFPLATDSDEVVVAEREGTVCGLGWLSLESDTEAYKEPVDGEVVAIYVRPSAACEGVGTACYESLERTARDQSMETLGCWASLNAVGFYERLGFIRVAEREIAYETAPLPVVEMRRTLV